MPFRISPHIGEHGESFLVERHTAYHGTIYIAVLFDGLAGAVFEETVTDIVGGKTIEVADTASDKRLEDEHVAVTIQTRKYAKVECRQTVALIESEIDGCAVDLVADGEPFPTLVSCDTLLECPVQKRTNMAENARHIKTLVI